MLVVGVIDLLAGQAVHACGGRREQYTAVRQAAGAPLEPGDPLALAQAYMHDLGVSELYVADLDAILGRQPQDPIVARLAALGAPVWLDAGVWSVDGARRALAAGAARLVIGLETLPSYEALERIADAVGNGRAAFSLDVRDGQAVITPTASGLLASREPPDAIAARAADLGVGTIIVLDLTRVGTGAGLDANLIAGVRHAAPAVTLLAGGGVRGLGDLQRLRDLGCDGALVATALQDGRLGPADIAAVRRHDRSTR